MVLCDIKWKHNGSQSVDKNQVMTGTMWIVMEAWPT